ncbi:PAS domain-containing protein [Emergencia timonensis]|uniref:PAS domain-containing protein n=1 Tax=Emergencia timonensis TaxID=1776384 RepID=UPI0039967708
MAESKRLTMDQMTAVLDNEPVAIFVTALDDKQLLYANSLAKEYLRQPDGQIASCYQIAGFDRPCPFCKAEKMSRTELLVREYTRPADGRIYQLSGKIIDWADRVAHIEYIQDITAKKREEEQIKALKEELQTTFSRIPCGLCVYRMDGSKIYPVFHNPAFYEIMGYSQEHKSSVEQETTYLGVHREDLPLLRKKIGETIEQNGIMRHTYRLWNDLKGEYRFIQLDASVRVENDGSKTLYGVYSDVSGQMQLEEELKLANEKMLDIVNAIPGGVAVYKVSEICETVYFSDGVPELSGYTVDEYRTLIKDDAMKLTFQEDAAMVSEKLKEAMQTGTAADFEFRKQHRDGRIVWVHMQARQIGEEDGYPLIQCVYHNISSFKETQLELNHLINSIPGGIASFRVEENLFLPAFFSDGMIDLVGYSREECEKLAREDLLSIVYDPDQTRVAEAVKNALISGDVLDLSFRLCQKDGTLIWVRLNGRRIGPLLEKAKFYAVFTGMSTEARLFQSIANETTDGVYVIDKESYELLYANESKTLFREGPHSVGQKCYTALHGKNAPCAFCTLRNHLPDGEEHEINIDGTEKFYTARFIETDWSGIPAYVQYIRDVTEEVKTRNEKERLEQYFQTVIQNLPGGVAVIRYEKNGQMIPEYLSDGFALLTRMSKEDAWNFYKEDALIGVHPDDRTRVKEQLADYMAKGGAQYEQIYRLKKGFDGYMWVKTTFSIIQNKEGAGRIYAVYHDMTKEREEQEKLRQQFNDLIVQHYRTPGPDALIVGHCNISQDRILEIIDHTDSRLLDHFGTRRETFFTGLSSLIVEEAEQQRFLNTYLNGPALDAYKRKDTERILRCFVKLPKDEHGRYVQFKVNLVEAPDSGDITGILTVTDITESVVADKILHQLTISSYDYVIDLDLIHDTFKILTCSEDAWCLPSACGSHSKRVADMLQQRIVPRDQEQYAKALEPEEIRKRLEEKDHYTFAFSGEVGNGDIRTMNLTVSAIDLRLGRVCLARTDITESVREQQGLLNMIAYTFELAGFIDINSRSFTMYTRQTVLQNLSPFIEEDYALAAERFTSRFCTEEEREEVRTQFNMETMQKRLAEKPAGYDFVFNYQTEDSTRFKQINVLWGDENHQTICMVRADVTDMLTAERQAKQALEQALDLAEEANRAKSGFLSSMSHDIRTPMNAIVGMTTLAAAQIDNRERVADCLQKISISSKHLLSLINDVLDMSKIERSNITLNYMKIDLPELVEQLSAIMSPQAKDGGLQLNIRLEALKHPAFYGDSLRISQIFINILSNAVKFTPEGGNVDFLVEEVEPINGIEYARYRFTISDTGIGMPEEFLETIFEPFNRSRAVSNIEGTGLGLSITKGLIDLMDGVISVESEINKGSAFTVELECKVAQDTGETKWEPRQTAPAFEGDSRFNGRLFLVAEDNAINSEILCELLLMYGAKSVLKKDGLQTVRAFQEAEPGTFDAILMDIQMPEMDGYQATREIRKLDRPDAKTIPIVAMTANAFSEDIQQSKEVGMDAHVAKPIDIDVLCSTLEKVLHG